MRSRQQVKPANLSHGDLTRQLVGEKRGDPEKAIEERVNGAGAPEAAYPSRRTAGIEPQRGALS
ncbi:MAG TPA: hypothetical protein DEP84_25955 [Chloroflexi bacterium]|nr:hypothetical protein [Chloroflexota bacterium]